jgi:hypothetical protein
VTKRTTLTLDDDVASSLQEEARRRGRPFRQVVNDAIRAGLDPSARQGRRLRVRPRDLGLRDGIELDDITGLLEAVEGPEHR